MVTWLPLIAVICTNCCWFRSTPLVFRPGELELELVSVAHALLVSQTYTPPVSVVSLFWSRMMMLPTERPAVLSRLICVVPLAYPAVQFAALPAGTPPVQIPVGLFTKRSAPHAQRLTFTVYANVAWSATAPRRVRLLFPATTIPAERW